VHGFIPQISAQAASEAMTAMLIAHYEREMSNQGQHIDLSIQESGIGILQATRDVGPAQLEYMWSGNLAETWVARRLAFACKDGFAILLQGGGGSVRMVRPRRVS
jgi:crotonobetainyl-CoA:carnitine CoA-transferase CaiB-like acyl-CoA transferase